jgi:hypothetical protein
MAVFETLIRWWELYKHQKQWKDLISEVADRHFLVVMNVFMDIHSFTLIDRYVLRLDVQSTRQLCFARVDMLWN